MLTPHIQHPLVFVLFVAELVALVVFVHQGILNALLLRSGGRPELRAYAWWCFWSAAFTCCFLTFPIEVPVDLRVLALHGMTITGALAMRSYMLSIGLYLRVQSPWLTRLARLQPLFAIWPAASALWYLVGGEPFFLGYHERPPPSLVLQIVGETVPRNAVNRFEAAAMLLMLIADLVVLVAVAWRAPVRDRWIFTGILVTCAAVAFEVIGMRVGFRYAIPVLFGANLIEVLRITYVSTLRVGREAALLEQALVEQRTLVESQMRLLRDATKWSTLGELSSGLGHEMRNPLGSATLFVEAARRRVKAETEEAALLGNASKALGQLAALVTSIGRYGQPSRPGSLRPLPLRPIVEDAVVLCATRIRQSGGSVQVDVDSGLVVVGRHTELTQVFVNLLANGCDAVSGAAEKKVDIRAERGADTVVVRVSDSGTRPDADVARSMFTPFFTTKAEGGTGLGLSISRRILEKLGGTVTFDARAERTTFVLRLPAAVEVAPSAARGSEQEASSTQSPSAAQ